MEYFLDTVETIDEGKGFASFGRCHLIWLAVFILTAVICSVMYRKSNTKSCAVWRKVFACLLIADELFKIIMLVIGGNYLPKYLPLHLCSINIFVIAIHAFRPSKVLDNYLYTVALPASILPLLTPTWSTLPLANFMHIHSFTVHILLAVYPIMLLVGGCIKPEIRQVPKMLLALAVLAVPALIANLLFDTNFMFLMFAEAGTPLVWFEENMGSHLWGFPIIIAAVITLMHTPFVLIKRLRNKC